jgi:hypothetical protein
MDDEDAFKLGFEKMQAIIQPEAILNYGSAFDWMNAIPNILSIPYGHPSGDRDKT